jgi:hypothetical protein
MKSVKESIEIVKKKLWMIFIVFIGK